MPQYNHEEIDDKWQERWASDDVFSADEDADQHFYCLEMFPYPSGKLHMGHVRNYALGDCISRYKRLQGNAVLHPMGWDAFGLPAENAAIERGADPEDWTKQNIEALKEQMNLLGFDYDWNREIKTCDPDYYRWDQWIFLHMLDDDLAYRDKAEVNWCPSCQTVLANEQVENNECWRCDTAIEKKDMEQWKLRITEYADELTDGLDELSGWPDKVRKMQRDWIGRSQGTTITFAVNSLNERIDVFTTRPDTVYGATFMAVAPEHRLASQAAQTNDRVKNYVDQAKQREDREREARNKSGIFTGHHAENPVTGDQIPVYVAEFVLPSYGSGAIMGVPAHDQRDHDFAQKHDIDIEPVIEPSGEHSYDEAAYEEDGDHINSDILNGHRTEEAIQIINDYLERNEVGSRTTQYTLQDWLISRQRYWGTPIPIIYCESCGAVPVPEDDLPVELPDDVEFTEKGNPLETSEAFKHVSCPQCGEDAERETDTMDTFMNSSWYFLRYCDPTEEDAPVNTARANDWMPVDQYIGGIEHAVMHLLYARFVTRYLRDQDLVDVNEPFKSLLCQGMVHLDGKMMSKSKGHVVSPEETVEEYGADTARTFMLFLGHPEKAVDWSDEGIQGTRRFLDRVASLPQISTTSRVELTEDVFNSRWNRLIKRITEAMNDLRLHEAIKYLMEWQSLLATYDHDERAWQKSFNAFIRCLNPFAPHLTEEIWHENIEDTYCSTQNWPSPNPEVIDDNLEYQHSLAKETFEDYDEIRSLTGIENPGSVTAVIPADWKYNVARTVQGLIADNALDDAVQKVMQTDARRHGDDAVSLVQTYLNDQSKLPGISAEKSADIDGLNRLKNVLPSLEVVEENTFEDPKANTAIPGKPALILHEKDD